MSQLPARCWPMSPNPSIERTCNSRLRRLLHAAKSHSSTILVTMNSTALAAAVVVGSANRRSRPQPVVRRRRFADSLPGDAKPRSGTMTLPTLSCAQAIRDGGIHAVAALNAALAEALVHAPETSHREIKLAIGRAMNAVLDETVNQAVRLYPELDPDDKTWGATVKARAAALAAS